ncbi:hypothetical protein FQN55_005373 [Onygenales sp. PD_40]|nr:hypothetical protein FQN55_005373 [Onygenales sp. PD_40]
MDDRTDDSSDAVVKKEVKQKWTSYIWDTFDKSPEERKFLFKIDAAILTFASLGYFIKYLDQININNAFVSGMKEDLGLYKNQLNYMQTAWTVGYVIGEIPSNIALTRVRPKYWIPTMEVIWSVLTFALSRCNSPTQFYILRFFIVALAQKRMELEGRKKRAPYTKEKIKKIFTSWHIYLLSLLYVTFNNAGTGSQPVFQQFLKESKDPKYTVKQINTYPTATSGVQVITTLIYAWTSDSVFKGARWPPILFGSVINIMCSASLSIWDIPVGWKWACFILAGCSGGLSGLCMAWAHEVCSSNNEERAIVIGSMNEMAYVFQTWLPLIVWQQVDAPRYHKGYITSMVMSSALIVTALTIRKHDETQSSSQDSESVETLTDDIIRADAEVAINKR